MRRWNGWGDEATSVPLGQTARVFIAQALGEGGALRDATLPEVIARVPPSRLPVHPLVSQDPELRVRHARGQSLADWFATRSGEFGRFPDGVALPCDSAEVRALLDFAATHDVALIPYGGGTSVAGHINAPRIDRPVLTVSLARMDRLLHLERESQLATFGAGTPGPRVEAQLAPLGYTLGHYPQSWELATLGGWVAARSSGQQSLRYGRIEQMFAGGHLETPAGPLDIPTFPASSAGPDLREMILGSEGRMGIITEIKARVTPLPEREDFFAVFFPCWEAGVAALRTLAQLRVPLSMMRLSNAIETWTQLRLAGHERAIGWLEKYLALRGADEGKCMFTFGVTGTHAACRATLSLARAVIRAHRGVTTGTALGKAWKKSRFMAPYLREPLWQLGIVADTVETAVDWQRVTPTLQAVEGALRGGLADEGERVHVYTHLSHLYPQGSSIYTTYLYRAGASHAQGLARWHKLKHAASRAIVQGGGTISHQHGVGTDHAPWLVAEKGPLGLGAIASLCRHFDPQGIMNPGKLLPENG